MAVCTRTFSHLVSGRYRRKQNKVERYLTLSLFFSLSPLYAKITGISGSLQYNFSLILLLPVFSWMEARFYFSFLCTCAVVPFYFWSRNTSVFRSFRPKCPQPQLTHLHLYRFFSFSTNDIPCSCPDSCVPAHEGTH